MGSAPQRKVPKSIMILVPGIVLGIVLILIAVAWRSNTEERTRSEVPDAGDVEATVQAQNAVFLGCTDCHGDIDAVFKEGGAPNLKYTHEMHFGKGVSDCSVCHFQDTHLPDEIKKPTMSRCFTCHGLTKNAIVKSTCESCHPASLDPKPTSHEAGNWVALQHSKAALEDQFQCLTCHTENTCNSCHGLSLPHSSQWAEAEHVPATFEDPQVCQRCHPTAVGSPQLTDLPPRDDCDECHHPQGSQKTPWIENHPDIVKVDGATTCFQCHAPDTCAACHVRDVFELTADEQLWLQESQGA